MFRNTLIAAAALAALALPAHGEGVSDFDIRGVRIGDPIDAVKARFPEMVFRQSNYLHPRFRDTYHDLTGALIDRIGGRLKRGYDELAVFFTGDGKVFQVSLTQDLGAAGCDEVFEKVVSKYGEPTQVESQPSSVAGRWYDTHEDYLVRALASKMFCYEGHNASLSLELFDRDLYTDYLADLESKVTEAEKQRPARKKRDPKF
jgi:hypothetical protein